MIIINGKKQSIRLTYEDVISRAGYEPSRIISVTYRTQRSGDEQRSGSLSPGQSVEIEAGMIFNAYDTSNA